MIPIGVKFPTWLYQDPYKRLYWLHIRKKNHLIATALYIVIKLIYTAVFIKVDSTCWDSGQLNWIELAKHVRQDLQRLCSWHTHNLFTIDGSVPSVFLLSLLPWTNTLMTAVSFIPLQTGYYVEIMWRRWNWFVSRHKIIALNINVSGLSFSQKMY